MAVNVFGINHVVLEVSDVKAAVEFYTDVFNLDIKDQEEDAAFLYLGNHQFMALAETAQPHDDRERHFCLMVRDEEQIAEVREKITKKYGLTAISPFRCDFHDPWGNRIQVGDMSDESTAWLRPYEEVQVVGAQLPD